MKQITQVKQFVLGTILGADICLLMCSFQFWISWQKIGPTLFMFILFTSFTSFTLELVPEQRSLAWLSRKAGKAPKFGWSFESK